MMNTTRLPRAYKYAWAATLVLLLASYFFRGGSAYEIPYSEFKANLAKGRVAEVTINSTIIRGVLKHDKPRRMFTAVRVSDEDLLRDLQRHDVKVMGERESTFWSTVLSSLLPVLLLLTFFVWSVQRAGGQGGLMSVGRSKAKIYMEKEVKVSFADVAGVDEAKEELSEVIAFLQTPDKFKRLGGKLPKGILLVGPPGTGKTLLARAVAGEAAAPFFSMSGSEFVEMFVGVGAARVRDLFTQAKSKAPCIIFIDELDALGKARGMGPTSHDEREQTLNQLLVELDGFDTRSGVILMAATNRPEILDPALLRAGRFDRHVLVDRPDRAGRLAILKVHARGVKLEDESNLEVIAAMTPGLVGADLANLINEAALLAVRRGKDNVELLDLQEAVERVIAGLEKRNRILNPLEKERVAHHEVGHALLAMALPGLGSVQKISIIPRGISALGYTLQLPTEDRFLMTQTELENKIAILLGGRVAEELVFHELSTGAQDDLLKATDIARSMVKVYGMGRNLGSLSFERDQHNLLVGSSEHHERGDYSEPIAHEIDGEIRRIVDAQYARATQLLSEKVNELKRAAQVLLSKETLSGEELRALVERPLSAPAVAA